jgi:hypothetical protein
MYSWMSQMKVESVDDEFPNTDESDEGGVLVSF